MRATRDPRHSAAHGRLGPLRGRRVDRGNIHLRTALYHATTDETHSLMLAKAIVAAKLQNSRKVVERWARDENDPTCAQELGKRATWIGERVPRVAGATTSDHVRGIEGDAARIYFGGLAEAVEKSELRFSARSRRPPRDPVNAMLGFCYGLLVTEFIGAIESVGLDYQMGSSIGRGQEDRHSRWIWPRNCGQ